MSGAFDFDRCAESLVPRIAALRAQGLLVELHVWHGQSRAIRVSVEAARCFGEIMAWENHAWAGIDVLDGDTGEVLVQESTTALTGDGMAVFNRFFAYFA